MSLFELIPVDFSEGVGGWVKTLTARIPQTVR